MARPRDPHPSLEALRARAYRERRAAGLKSYLIAVDDELAKAKLISLGRLERDEAEDPYMVSRALEELLDDVLCS